MKKIIVLLIIMMLGVTGCKKDSAETQASPVVTATPVPTATATPTSTPVPTATPEVFDIRDEDGLMEKIDEVLVEAGVDDVEDIIIENVEKDSGLINIDAKIITEQRMYKLSAIYVTYRSETEWSVKLLEDYNNKEVCYWMPDEDGLMEEVDAVLEEAGVDDVEDIIIENVEDYSSSIKAYIKIITGQRTLKLSASYLFLISDHEWSIVSLGDYEKEEVRYWSPVELRKLNDIYDYKTGKLVSKKSEEPKDIDELLEEFEKANE